MSLYNREALGHRHASIFNRAHHPIVPETTSSSTQAHAQIINTRVPGIIPVGTGAGLSPLIPTPLVHPPIPSPTDSGNSESDFISSTNADVTSSSPVVAVPSSSLSPSLSPSPSPSSLTSANVVASPSFSPAPAPTTTLSSSNSLSDTTSSSPSKSGLSSGAIGAIVTIVVLALAALTAFIVRKLYIRHRTLKRNTWGAGLVPALQTKRSTVYGGDDEKQSFTSMQQREKSTVPVLPPMTTGFANSPNMLTPPPPLYNSAPMTATSPVKSMSPTRATPKADLAIVVRTFVPSLPDELNITTGEHVRILMAYDDGWTLCTNGRNEQGVVPLQCLQRAGATTTTTLQLQPQSEFGYGSDQGTKRMSSLAPNANGTY